VIRVPLRIEAGQLEAGLGEQLVGGEIIGPRFRRHRPQPGVTRFLDDLIHHRRRQPLPAMVVIHPQIDQL